MERDLWPILSRLITLLDRQMPTANTTHSVGRIVRVYLWAALHDRPVYWACKPRNWAGVKPPRCFPSQPTMSRRLKQTATQSFITKLMDLLAPAKRDALLMYMDGKPLPIAKHAKAKDAGIGRGAGGFQKGYKIHAIYAENNRPVAFEVNPMNVDERVMAKHMLENTPLGEGYLLADANYETNPLYEQTGLLGRILVTPRRFKNAKGLGQSRQHSQYRINMLERMRAPASFTKQLLHVRRRVETRFAHLVNFGGGLTHLPPWVRGLERVHQYVCAKLIIRLAVDQLKAAGA